MRRTWAVLPVLAVAVTLLPAAAAQGGGSADDGSTKVTFYPHTFGITRAEPMPANTEYPWGEDDFSVGITTSPFGCGTPPPAPQGSLSGQGQEGVAYNPSCDEATFNEFWAYTTAGFVEETSWTEVRDEDFVVQYENFHNERGQSKDILLDTGKPIDASLYMSADWSGAPITACVDRAPPDVPWPVPCMNWDPGRNHDWQVQATLYSGPLGEYGAEASTRPPIPSAHENGSLQVVAQGDSDPITVTSLQVVDYPTVWEIPIELGPPQVDRIPKEHDIVIRYQWWHNTSGNRYIMPTPTSYVIPFFWNLNGGEFYPNRFTLPVENPIAVEVVAPTFVHGKLALLGVINTPWGSYDVDPDSVEVSVRDAATGRPVDLDDLTRVTDYSVAHGGHYKPFNVTWIWDYQAQGLAPGTYEVEIAAANWQGSASASCTATFTVEEGPSPGPTSVNACGLSSINGTELGKYRDAPPQDGSTLGLEVAEDLAPLSDEASSGPGPTGSGGSADQVSRDVPIGGLAVLGLGVAAGAAVRRRVDP